MHSLTRHLPVITIAFFLGCAFSTAQADNFDKWGFWSGSGAGNPGGNPIDGLPGGPTIGGPDDQSGPLGDEIFDAFVDGIPGPGPGPGPLPATGPDTVIVPPPNPFAFEDPPDGTWDLFAAYSQGDDCGEGCGNEPFAATGTLQLTSSTVDENLEIGDGPFAAVGPNADGAIGLSILDMDSDATRQFDINGMCEGECGDFAIVGDGGDSPFVPFFGFGGPAFAAGNPVQDEGQDEPDNFFAVGNFSVRNGAPLNQGDFFAGQRTPSADLQAMNLGDVQADYGGSTSYYGHDVGLHVNFAGSDPSWTGNFADGYVHIGNVGITHNFTASGGFDPGGIGVSNNVAGDATSGQVVFSFFGPQAQRLGGALSVSGTVGEVGTVED